MHRAAWLALALAALAPAAAKAQFTTLVVPPPRTIDSAKAATVAGQGARTDSTTRVAITNMKAWVDSAAAVPRSLPVDTTPVAADTTPRAAPAPERTTTSFSNGEAAPATASYLPLVALLGVASLSVGIVLFVGRKRA